MIRNMVKAFFDGRVGIITKVTMLKMKDKAMVKCIGLMVLIIKGIGLRGFNMDLVL
jgi:hypothetical protein